MVRDRIPEHADGNYIRATAQILESSFEELVPFMQVFAEKRKSWISRPKISYLMQKATGYLADLFQKIANDPSHSLHSKPKKKAIWTAKAFEGFKGRKRDLPLAWHLPVSKHPKSNRVCDHPKCTFNRRNPPQGENEEIEIVRRLCGHSFHTSCAALACHRDAGGCGLGCFEEVNKCINSLKINSDNNFRKRFHLPQDNVAAEIDGESDGECEASAENRDEDGEGGQEHEREANVLDEMLISIPDVDSTIAEQDGKRMVDSARQIIENLTVVV
jgi:hypothetical protein